MKQIMEEVFQNGATATDSLPSNDESRSLRVLRLIEHLACASHPLTLSQLAQRLQVPKATMMRTLDDLERHSYVLRTPSGRGYVPGAAATHLALVTLRNNALLRLCRTTLGTLVGLTGETCNLTVPDGSAVIYVDRVETAEPLRLNLAPGTRVPMHCTASGKLFLAHLPLLEQRKLLAAMTLTPLTANTLTGQLQLETALARIAKSGIGIDDEEFVLGMVAIAVPICAADGSVVAAIACHAPVARKSVAQLLQFVPHLNDAAATLLPVLVESPVFAENGRSPAIPLA